MPETMDAPSKPQESLSQAEPALSLISQRKLRYVDWWYTDLAGKPWRFMSPADTVDERTFLQGNTLDARATCPSWRGLVNILPDASSAFVDPVATSPTAAVFCDLRDPSTGVPLELEGRHVLRRAEEHLLRTLAATATIGCEAEFILFEGGRPAPEDRVWDLLRALAAALTSAGIPVEAFRYGPGVSQGRVQLRQASPLATADRIVFYREVAQTIARRMGLTLSFLPKPMEGETSAGMPIHVTLWREGSSLFHDEAGWALTSAICRQFAGGLLRRAPALAALVAPTTNSYRRLMPGVDAPIQLKLSREDHGAAVRIPARSSNPAARRVRFGLGDPQANPYLYFAGVLMAGIDGVESRLEPRPDAAPEPGLRLPDSLEEALRFLEADREFLLRGGVFSGGLLDAWSELLWRERVLPVRARPHPWELRQAGVE